MASKTHPTDPTAHNPTMRKPHESTAAVGESGKLLRATNSPHSTEQEEKKDVENAQHHRNNAELLAELPPPQITGQPQQAAPGKENEKPSSSSSSSSSFCAGEEEEEKESMIEDECKRQRQRKHNEEAIHRDGNEALLHKIHSALGAVKTTMERLPSTDRGDVPGSIATKKAVTAAKVRQLEQQMAEMKATGDRLREVARERKQSLQQAEREVEEAQERISNHAHRDDIRDDDVPDGVSSLDKHEKTLEKLHETLGSALEAVDGVEEHLAATYHHS